MPNKKKKKSRTDELFGGSVFGDFDLFEKLGEGKRVEGGYSISVSQTPEGTKVHAKVGKDTEVNELRRQLQQQYPGAQIEIEGGRPLIKEIETKKVEEEDKEA
ncbi:MAG: hypothetical protein NWF14_07870 [Candidatus Bathyarchaeota archaeon]|nr:hypothetical protein [Candidatus Bathyarchaeota archaeon]